MDREKFLNLSQEAMARLVQQMGPKVCAFPINGTRRWFMLEHPEALEGDAAQNYMNIVGDSYIRLYQLFFDHGIHTLLSPVFGADLLKRGEYYVRSTIEGMARLTKHPTFLAFYEANNVRVRFYGDYRKHLQGTAYAAILDDFDAIAQKTAANDGHRLFFGVFASDATEAIAELAVAYYQQHQRVPDRSTLVALYYGEPIPPVDLFIGFDKFSAFDMPLLAIGEEDLYFTVAPSPYLTQRQLRAVLFDHMYSRPEPETDYTELTPEDWNAMHAFYRANLEHTQGIGVRQNRGNFWRPKPQVTLPEP